MAKEFHLGDVLTITTGRVLGVNGMDGIYKILNYMTGENLFTHQIPRASQQARPHIITQHPQLANVVLPDEINNDNCKAVVEELCAKHGAWFSLEPIAEDLQRPCNPIEELTGMIPAEKIVTVVTNEKKE